MQVIKELADRGLSMHVYMRSQWFLVLVLFAATGFMLSTFSFAYAKMVTITFEDKQDGEVITTAYKEQGVVLRCEGPWPESPYVKDKKAYSWRDAHAVSGSHVMGGRFFGDGLNWAHWLSHDIGYATATFVDPTDHVCLYGVGGPFLVHAYGIGGRELGSYDSEVADAVSHATGKPVQFVEIRVAAGADSEVLIKKISFGSIRSLYESDLTVFDDLSFNVNQYPIAGAGEDGTFYEGDTIMLDGTDSVDFDENDRVASYRWEQTSGPFVMLSDVCLATPTFVAPPVDGNGTALSFKLTVEDTWGLQSSAEVTCYLLDNGIESDIFPGNAITLLSATLEPIAIETGEGVYLTRLTAVDPRGSVDLFEQMPEDMFYGLIDFDVVVETPGEAAVLKIYLPNPAPGNSKWYKYHPSKGWFDFDRDIISEGLGDGAEFNEERRIVTLYVTDNGDYDDNPKDGCITDPSGLGAEAVDEKVGTAISADASKGLELQGEAGKGGCFISVAFEAGSSDAALFGW